MHRSAARARARRDAGEPRGAVMPARQPSGAAAPVRAAPRPARPSNTPRRFPDWRRRRSAGDRGRNAACAPAARSPAAPRLHKNPRSRARVRRRATRGLRCRSASPLPSGTRWRWVGRCPFPPRPGARRQSAGNRNRRERRSRSSHAGKPAPRASTARNHRACRRPGRHDWNQSMPGSSRRAARRFPATSFPLRRALPPRDPASCRLRLQ